MSQIHLIDDNRELCQLSAEILRDAGFDAHWFDDPVRYVQSLSQQSLEPPTAIFTDIRMPEMDGHTLIRKVRELFPDQKFVIVSGFDSEHEDSYRSVCHFLLKPFRPEELIGIAEALIKCEKEGPAAETKTNRISLAQKLDQFGFECPLDCLECNPQTA